MKCKIVTATAETGHRLKPISWLYIFINGPGWEGGSIISYTSCWAMNEKLVMKFCPRTQNLLQTNNREGIMTVVTELPVW